MKCYQPILIKKNLNKEEYPDGLLVPCGHCYACKEQKAIEWGIRAEGEAKEWKHQYMITATYDNEHLQEYSLQKKDVTNWLKRINTTAARKTGKRGNYKYYLGAEYGEKTSRPHYHLLLHTDEKEIMEIAKNKWEKGQVDVQEVDIRGSWYVAGYASKKIGTKLNERDERVNPFRRVSRGYGLKRLLKNKDQYLKNGYIGNKQKKVLIPRYYFNKSEELGFIGEEYKKERKEKAKEKNRELKNYYIKKYGGKGYINQKTGEYSTTGSDEIQEKILEQRKYDYEIKYKYKDSKRNKI